MVLTENILIRKETMMQIQNINEESFKKYGKILTGYHVDGILAEMEHTPLTREVIYVPSVEEMEALPDAEEMKNRGFGGLPTDRAFRITPFGNRWMGWRFATPFWAVKPSGKLSIEEIINTILILHALAKKTEEYYFLI